jgi:hypothetical protein
MKIYSGKWTKMAKLFAKIKIVKTERPLQALCTTTAGSVIIKPDKSI